MKQGERERKRKIGKIDSVYKQIEDHRLLETGRTGGGRGGSSG